MHSYTLSEHDGVVGPYGTFKRVWLRANLKLGLLKFKGQALEPALCIASSTKNILTPPLHSTLLRACLASGSNDSAVIAFFIPLGCSVGGVNCK